MQVLVTGGAGYIGSHTCVDLLQAGHKVIVVDSLVNSKEESIRRIEEITGRRLIFHKADLLDKAALDEVFKKSQVDAVIHFAGLKAVGESVAMPLQYYKNNIIGSLVLFEIMANHGVQFFSNRIRRSGCTSHNRGFPSEGLKSLWLGQSDAGADTERSLSRRTGLERCPAPIFQPGGRPSFRQDRRGPKRYSQ